jgi:hypothetical protein
MVVHASFTRPLASARGATPCHASSKVRERPMQHATHGTKSGSHLWNEPRLEFAQWTRWIRSGLIGSSVVAAAPASPVIQSDQLRPYWCRALALARHVRARVQPREKFNLD